MIRHDWVGKVIHKELCKKFKFGHTNKWYMPNPESVLENEKNYHEFWDTNRSPNLGQTTRPIWQERERKREKGRTWRTVDFTVPVDDRMKTIENKKRDKYLELARELKKLWNMRVMVIPIVIGSLGTIPRGLLDKGTGRAGNRRTSRDHPNYNMRSARILRRDLETWEDLLPLRLQWKTIS